MGVAGNLLPEDQLLPSSPLPIAMDPNANPNPAYRLDPSMLRMLNRLPKEMVEKFSEAELAALYRAMPRSGHHAIDIRFSLPCLPKRLYFVFLIGQDRRAGKSRPEQQKPWTPATTAFAMLLGMATLITAYGVTYRMLNQRTAAGSAVPAAGAHPTALPWIETASECTGNTREWRDNLCFEEAHDPAFRR